MAECGLWASADTASNKTGVRNAPQAGEIQQAASLCAVPGKRSIEPDSPHNIMHGPGGIQSSLTRHRIAPTHIFCLHRQDKLVHFGNPVSPISQEKITRSQALQMYTTWGALAAFKENEIGRLKQGYRADLIILDRDVSRVPAKDLLKIRVLRTYVRGGQVFGTTDFESASH
jgi:hypothetical protein